MVIRRQDPWTLLNQLGGELNRLYEGQLDPDTSSPATSDWVPAVDIREDQDRFVIEADLPGVSPEQIDVQMENGMLTIRGHRESISRQAAEGYKRVERTTGNFYRRFSLPDTADAERISARTANGVLEVSIPKQEKLQPRRIQVEG